MNPRKRYSAAPEVLDFEHAYDAILGDGDSSATPGMVLESFLEGGKGATSALQDLAILRRWLDEQEPHLVRQARAEGESWYSIAASLGRSRQAVWQAYKRTDENDPNDSPTQQPPLPAAADAQGSRPCSAITTKGRRCKNPAAEDAEHCPYHLGDHRSRWAAVGRLRSDPALQEQRTVSGSQELESS